MWSNYHQKSLLVAVQSGKGHICFTKPFLLKMDCKISGWSFLKFLGFLCRFLLYCFFKIVYITLVPVYLCSHFGWSSCFHQFNYCIEKSVVCYSCLMCPCFGDFVSVASDY